MNIEQKEYSLIDSLRLIQKEKLFITLKELKHLKYIVNFYSNRDDNNITRDKEEMRSIQKSIGDVYLILRIVQKLINDYNETMSNFKFILHYDYINSLIEQALEIIEQIYKKVYQIFEESYNQYIPKPKLGRRFSNNNLIQALKRHFKEIINRVNPNLEHKKLILSWSYENYFKLELKQDKFLENHRDNFETYINLPYWYYELPILLPSMLHMIIRSTMVTDNQFSPIYNKLNKNIYDYLSKPRDDLWTFTIEERILESNNRLVEKVLADCIAYLIYGNAYIYSLFHDLIGYGFAKHFGMNYDDESGKIKHKMRSYRYNNKRDVALIRLNILAEISKNSKIQDLLKSIIDTKSNSELDDIYLTNHPHYRVRYENTMEAIKNVIELFTNFIKVNQSDIKNLVDSINQKRDYVIDYNELWQKRLKKGLFHKNEFRKLLHKETIKNLKILANNEQYSKDDIEEYMGKPFSMKYVKLHKYINCQDSKSNCLDEVMKQVFKLENYRHSFGIYDLFKITSSALKDEEDLDCNIQKQIDKIKDIDLNNLLRYYESRFSLMQIFPPILGNYKDNSAAIIYNLELNNTAKEEIKNILVATIEHLIKLFKENSNHFQKISIYKSLGPKDLMVYVEGINSEDFLYFNKHINKIKSIKRNFTTILVDTKGKYSVKPNNSYRIISYLRLKLDKDKSSEDILKDCYKACDEAIQEKIDDIFSITGALDAQVIWKIGTSTKEVTKFYDSLIKKGYISDFQTKINKKIEVK